MLELDSQPLPYSPETFLKLGFDPPPSRPSLYRWRTVGVRAQLIETFMLGGRRYTTKKLILEFVERGSLTSQADDRSMPEPNVAAPDTAAAMRALEADGI